MWEDSAWEGSHIPWVWGPRTVWENELNTERACVYSQFVLCSLLWLWYCDMISSHKILTLWLFCRNVLWPGKVNKKKPFLQLAAFYRVFYHSINLSVVEMKWGLTPSQWYEHPGSFLPWEITGPSLFTSHYCSGWLSTVRYWEQTITSQDRSKVKSHQ